MLTLKENRSIGWTKDEKWDTLMQLEKVLDRWIRWHRSLYRYYFSWFSSIPHTTTLSISSRLVSLHRVDKSRYGICINICSARRIGVQSCSCADGQTSPSQWLWPDLGKCSWSPAEPSLMQYWWMMDGLGRWFPSSNPRTEWLKYHMHRPTSLFLSYFFSNSERPNLSVLPTTRRKPEWPLTISLPKKIKRCSWQPMLTL